MSVRQASTRDKHHHDSPVGCELICNKLYIDETMTNNVGETAGVRLDMIFVQV